MRHGVEGRTPIDAAWPHRPVPAIPAATGTREPVAGAAGGERVMIVDDHVDAADALADLLRLDGYDARPCYGERQALEHAALALPAIVILDIAMPERGGHALARDLRVLLPRALLIAFTGFSRHEDIERSLHAGIDEHWVKPMSATSFSAALAAARARHARQVRRRP